ncbi:MAG: helix-turn-helix domain-containing protein [bacterium]|nr:helix-turn-helix domain-containing protein [bacterium]
MTTNDLNSLTVILIFGSLILLSFLKITNPLQVNKKANLLFGIFLLLWSTFWLDEISLLMGIKEIHLGFIIFVRSIQFFAPIIFYYSTVFFTNPNYRFKTFDLFSLLLPFVFLTFLLLQRLYEKDNQYTFQVVLTGIILAQALFYTTASFLRIRKHQKKILLFTSNTEEIDLSWLQYIIYLVWSISIIISIYNVLFPSVAPNLLINTSFLLVIFGIAYYSLKQKEIFPLDEKQRDAIISIEEEGQLTKMKRNILSDEDLILLKSQLTNLMKEKKPYLDSELNLLKLSELLKVTPHQLSYLINTGFSENFFQFINKYRVEKAKEILVKGEMNNFSILGIAYESGFNSKTSFNTTFKKITGQTPSEFKKRCSGL